MKNLNKRLIFALKLIVSAMFLCFIFSRIDFTVLLQSVREARKSQLFAAFIVLACGAFAGGTSWYNVIRANGLNVEYLRVLAMHWCGMFFNSFLPSNVGGDIYKGWMLVKDQQKGMSVVAASIIVDRALNFSILILIGVVSYAVMLGKTGFAAVVVLFALFCFALLNYAAFNWRLKDGGGRLVLFLQELLALFRMPGRSAAVLCAATLSQGCKIGCHIFIISALGLHIDYSCVWYVIPVFGIVSALPISIGGLGVRESVALLIAEQVGTTGDELVILSLLSHVLFVLVNSLGVIPFLFHHRRDG